MTVNNRYMRPTIGLITRELSDHFMHISWLGAADAAQAGDANLICYPANYPPITKALATSDSILYDLLDLDHLDGLLIWGRVAGLMSAEKKRRFYNLYRTIPKVVFADEVEGIPSVVVDNYGGMRQTLIHLIKVHGRRRIAFFRGIETFQEHEDRYRAYCDVLAEYGLPFDPKLVVRQQDTGIDAEKVRGDVAIQVLLDERQVDFDAIASNNDGRIREALPVLRARGMHVPRDVATVSIDDMTYSEFATPPLTTAPFPAYHMARQACELLLAQLQGIEIPKRTLVPMQLVVRQSCGCLDPAVSQTITDPMRKPTIQLPSEAPPPRPEGQGANQTVKAVIAPRRKEIVDTLVQAVTALAVKTTPQSVIDLFDAVVTELSADRSTEIESTFWTTLNDLLDQLVHEGHNVSECQQILSLLRHHMLPWLGDRETIFRAEELWLQGWAIIRERMRRVEGLHALQVERHTRKLSQIGQMLITTFEVDELMNILDRELPQIGIRRCYLSLYEDPQRPVDRSRLILAYDEQGRIKLKPDELVFPSRQLAPGRMFHQQKRYSLIVEPLYFQKHQLGIALFETGAQGESVYAQLRNQISSSLQGALLVQQVHKTQEQLIRQEKLAVLGQLAGGVGHELRNPLGVISNAVYFLQMVLPDADETVKDYLAMIATRVQEAEKIVSDLLNLSRNRSAERQACAVTELVTTLLARTPPPATVTVTSQITPDLPSVFVDPQQIGQVLTNLVTNAYQAMPDGGTLTIESRAEQDQVQLSVIDTGHGMSAEIMEKIFEPLFTTKAKGIGLGLALSKNLIEINGGEIKVESTEGQGSHFTVILPTKEISI